MYDTNLKIKEKVAFVKTLMDYEMREFLLNAYELAFSDAFGENWLDDFLQKDKQKKYKIAEYENGGKGNSKKGLDLLVIDSFTGSERPTSTLSGGETFMASISLALALTDVVQNRSGGIQLDSLFIDEGFGTLDNETLDKAIGVLNELQETKMVGIISHVDSLQSVIPSIIKVEKTQYGSHIKIKE